MDGALNWERIDVKSLAKNTGKVILALAAVGAILSLAVIAPNLPAALAELGDGFKRTPHRRIRKALRRLQKQRLIEVYEYGDEIAITVTERGKRRVSRFNFEHLQLIKPEHWDKQWRIIAFDVPEKFKRARRALRMKIKELGLYPLQKSVFVYPYPCKDEVDFIADFFNIGRYLNYIEATHIDDENHLKDHFQIRDIDGKET